MKALSLFAGTVSRYGDMQCGRFVENTVEEYLGKRPYVYKMEKALVRSAGYILISIHGLFFHSPQCKARFILYGTVGTDEDFKLTRSTDILFMGLQWIGTCPTQ